MNVGSGAQIRQLLFAGVQNQKPDKGSLELERVFKVGLHYFQQSIAVHLLATLFIAAGRVCCICGCSCTHTASSSEQISIEIPEQSHHKKGQNSELFG